MHGRLTPLTIAGPDEPHAQDGIPVRSRPSWGDALCVRCKGRGAWNAVLHLDSQRCIQATCDVCEGAGWLDTNGDRQRPDIVMVDGHPAWTLTLAPRTIPARDPVPVEENRKGEGP